MGGRKPVILPASKEWIAPARDKDLTKGRMKEKTMLRIVRLLPKTLVYWCAIEVVAIATTGKYSNTVVPDLPAMEAIKRYENTMLTKSNKSK